MSSVLWPIYKIGHYPNAYLSTADNKNIKLELYPDAGGNGISFTLPRRMARLLAKRLNQILNETAS